MKVYNTTRQPSAPSERPAKHMTSRTDMGGQPRFGTKRMNFKNVSEHDCDES